MCHVTTDLVVYCGKFKNVWNNVNILALIVEEIRTKASDVVGDN